MNDLQYIPASSSARAGPFGCCEENMKYIPANKPGGVGMMGLNFIPANLPGSQMMNNMKYISASTQHQLNCVDLGLKFVPADVLTSRIDVVKELTVSWWEENSIFFYDKLLVSAYYGMNKFDFRDYYHIPRKNFTLVGDSGGFQIANIDGTTIDPIKLAEWYNQNVDLGFILDTPIVKNGVELPANMFDKVLQKTYDDTEKLVKHCTIPLFGVLHGHTPEQMDKWWKKMSDFHFDGWCGGAKPPSNAILQALISMKLKSYGVKKLHILGVSGFSITPILAYLSQHFDMVTYDSASYGTGAMFRKYILPIEIGDAINFGREEKGKIKKLPCDCEVCRTCTAESLYEENSLAGALISLHNLLIYIRYNTYISGLVNDKLSFTALIKKRCDEQVTDAINFIDYSLEKGVEVGYEAFKHKMNQKEVGTSQLKF